MFPTATFATLLSHIFRKTESIVGSKCLLLIISSFPRLKSNTEINLRHFQYLKVKTFDRLIFIHSESFSFNLSQNKIVYRIWTDVDWFSERTTRIEASENPFVVGNDAAMRSKQLEMFVRAMRLNKFLKSYRWWEWIADCWWNIATTNPPMVDLRRSCPHRRCTILTGLNVLGVAELGSMAGDSRKTRPAARLLCPCLLRKRVAANCHETRENRRELEGL